ncbi:TIGR01777 family oxidoreductase [Paenibacillus marinisediminis]
MKRKVVLAGGSGFLGESYAKSLRNQGDEVVILTRGRTNERDGIRYVQWDGRTIGDWERELDGADAVVNFTGKSVNCIYSEANQKEIIRSRLDSVKVIDEALLRAKQRPPVLVQAASLAIFGNTKEPRDEQGVHGTGFSVRVCQMWEKVFFQTSIPNVRKVALRIGFALGPGGGALEPLMKLTRYGLGGTVGRGDQMISWLHLDDLNQIIDYVIQNPNAEGIYNATGLQPVTNREFMKTLRTVMNKGWAPAAPAPIVRLGAYMIMRADPELALSGRNCIPKRLQDEGFSFKYTNLEQALRNIIQD